MLASSLKPKERLASTAIELLILQFGAEMSYRKSTTLLNQLFHRDNSNQFKLKTISDHIMTKGAELCELKEATASNILSKHEIVIESGSVPETPVLPSLCKYEPEITREKLKDDVNTYNQERIEGAQIKNKWFSYIEHDPSSCVYISIDDVGVKHQKDKRKDGGFKEGKRVENTVSWLNILERNTSSQQ